MRVKLAVATVLLCQPLAGSSLSGQVVGGRPTVGGQVGGAGPRYPIDPLSVPRPSIRAVRIDGPLDVDGLLDDEAWGRTSPTTEVWVQTIPDLGMPASEHTTMRILYDDVNLYIGAVLYDSDTDHLSVPGLNQDFDTPNSDMFGVALDTYHDRQNGFLFATNPAGAIFDAQAFNDQSDIIPAWEGIVDVRTSVNDSSWIVEMAIPFATLRFNPIEGEQIWGLNFFRRVRRRNEDSFWAPVPLQYRVYKFSMAGTLEGLVDLPHGRNLWMKPFVLGDRLTGARLETGQTDGEVGLDIKWGITPRMTLDLTANTDFSQVEVDAEQVNLTRFSLFFPEKRDFFLENEGTFGFQDVSIRNYRTGSNSRNFRLFHSRSIGLSSTREVLPIGGGARLTGRIGDRFEVGFLDMQTRSTDGLSDGSSQGAENFAVARVKTNFSNGATLGGLFVNRQETAANGVADYNRAYGVDGRMSVFQNLVLSGYWARTDERDPVGDDANIAMFQAAWRSVFWDVSGLYKQVGDGFNPKTGFIDRTDVRRYFGTVGGHPRVLALGIREINPYVDVDFFTNLAGELETRRVQGGMVFSLLNGGSVSVTVADRFERLFQETRIAGVPVAVGQFDWVEPSVQVSTSGSRALFGSASVRWGDFYDGSRTSVTGNLTFRPNEHFSIKGSVQHNDLTLGGSTFTADIFSGRLLYAHNTRTFFMAFVQYNEASDELIGNVRFNLIHAPLSDVFLVYTERRSLADGVADTVLERGVTLKVTKLLAF